MRTIVAPTDFSATSRNAVNYAADLASVIGTSLSLIHVCYLPIPVSEVAGPQISMDDLVEDAEVQMSQLKEELLNRTGERIQVDTIIRVGDVVSGIKEFCDSVNTYAVIMGAETEGAFERFLVGGGKTLSAMKKFSWPLVVVPPGVRFVSIRKIGLACDLKRVVDTIPVKEIKSIVNEFHAEFHVLHVNTETSDSLNPEPIEESGWLQDILGELNPRYDFIHGTDIENSIKDFAEKNNFDLLIVIPKKHNLISKMFQHSHTERLVLYSHVPIMAIHE